MHHALPHGFKIDEEELRFLDREELVDCELTRGADGETIRPTRAGHQLAESMRALEGDQQAPEGAAVALDWADVARPTLEAAHQVWTSWDAPPSGVPIQAVAREMGREEDDAKTYRAVDLLQDRGYLGAPSGASVNDAPALLTVTPLGLEVVGGWPATSAEAATAALLAALDREIEATDEPEQRGRLEQLRTTAIEVGSGTLTQVLAHVIKGGL